MHPMPEPYLSEKRRDDHPGKRVSARNRGQKTATRIPHLAPMKGAVRNGRHLLLLSITWEIRSQVFLQQFYRIKDRVKKSMSSSMGRRSCFMVSRSRIVTALSESERKSKVTQYGVPISSCLRYRFPIDRVSSY